MIETKQIEIGDYDYSLPDEQIAKYPVAERDSSKLLVYRQGNITTDVFMSLPDYLPKDTMLVFNNTKVIQARLRFRKESGARIEIFCLEPLAPRDYAQMFQQTARCEWLCLVGNGKKWKSGALHKSLVIRGKALTLSVERGATQGLHQTVAFSWGDATVTFADVLDAVGELPVPPYLNRETEERDKETYQTVYSKIKGSVAAPTAGLHFTDRVLAALDRKGIVRDEITLHVGAGTFKPVKTRQIADHEMHTEHIFVPRTSIEKLLEKGGRCTAVGTTTVRTLESLYYTGVKLARNPQLSEEELHVRQWEPYEYARDPHPLTTVEALTHVLCYLRNNGLEALHIGTQIIIAPGYVYHVVERMITNFHQPRSTLLLLVSAFLKGDWHKVYDYALINRFRFLSYGDSSLLIP